MALRTRKDLMDIETRLDTKKITSVSRLVSEVTGIPVQPNKAIVGRNAFAHESGIHQHGVLKQRTTYEILAPEDIGLVQSNIVLESTPDDTHFVIVLRLLVLSLRTMNSTESLMPSSALRTKRRQSLMPT